MLDFADAVVINKFERRGAEDALRDVRRQLARNRERFDVDPETLPVFGTIAVALQRRRRHRALPAPARPCCRARPRRHRGHAAAGGGPGRAPKIASIVPPERSRYLAEIAETVRGSPRHHRRAGRRRRARSSSLLGAKRRARRAGRRHRRPRRRARATRWRPSTSRDRGRCSTGGRPRSTSSAADARRRVPLVRESLSGTLVPRVALPRYEDAGELLRFLRVGEPARPLPVHRRRVPAQARGRGPGPDVRRRGRRLPHQPPVPPARRGPARHPAVDRVRLRHALRLRPRRAARHLRQGRQLRRVDRHARRHEGALRRVRPVRPDHLGVDDDQRARARRSSPCS